MPIRLGLFELLLVSACLMVFIAIVAVLAVSLLRSRPTAGKAKERPDEEIPLVMTVEEVAALLRSDTATVEGLIQDGKLPAVKVGQDWRISQANLIAFINAGGEAKGKNL